MIDRLLTERRVLITCGTGGVGKTTVSAALALRAARLGRKALVITIDPAKRLGTSLGIQGIGDEPQDLGSRTGLPVGALSAVMPDTLTTFQEFVRELSPVPEHGARLMRNPIFQIFAREFSGTNEYMAIQKLYKLARSKRYDLIVLDTPPSRNTLDFLDAPKLLDRFFEEKMIRWLILPTHKLVSGGMRKALGVLEKLTGAGFMTHLFDFANALFEVRENFQANLAEVSRLLKSRDVGFLLVSAPSPEKVAEAGHFVEAIRDHDFNFEGVVLNRTLGYLGDAQGLGECTPILEGLMARERRTCSRLLEEILDKAQRARDDLLYAELPELARDVHSLADLEQVALSLSPAHGTPSGSSAQLERPHLG